MKKTVTFATSFRVKAALCCSVAVLLTACGGTVDEAASQQSLAGMSAGDIIEGSGASATGAVNAGAATPGSVVQDTTAPDPVAQAVDGAAAPVAPSLAPAPPSPDTGMANAVDAQAEGGPAPATNEFNLNGYQDNAAAFSDDAANRGTTAASGADGQQATQLPAL